MLPAKRIGSPTVCRGKGSAPTRPRSGILSGAMFLSVTSVTALARSYSVYRRLAGTNVWSSTTRVSCSGCCLAKPCMLLPRLLLHWLWGLSMNGTENWDRPPYFPGQLDPESCPDLPNRANARQPPAFHLLRACRTCPSWSGTTHAPGSSESTPH